MFDLSALIMPPEKVAARRGTVGASDMPVIMGGDEARIIKLWEFKRGGEQDDLSDVLPVLLGLFTEPFNLALFARRSGIPVVPCEPVARGIMSASPDGIADGNAVIDAKHVGPYKSEAEIGTYYAPQLFAQMHCTGLQRAFISVIRGNSDLFWMEYEWADNYGAAVVDAAHTFWACVQNGTHPVPLPPPPAPKPVGVREVDMSDSNFWCSFAGELIDTLSAHQRHEEAKKNLKELIEPDVTRAFGAGVEFRRDKRGALRLHIGEVQ